MNTHTPSTSSEDIALASEYAYSDSAWLYTFFGYRGAIFPEVLNRKHISS